MHVVILAAGMGSRLGGEAPKPLAEVAPGRTLLGNQVEALSGLVGRDRIMVVVGHRALEIMAAHPDLMFAYNPRYKETNTAKSLLCALRKFDGDVLWTNADLYFEPAAAGRLLESDGGSTRLLVDRAHVGKEEIKYTLREDGTIAELSKSVQAPLGEALGMNIIAGADLPEFIRRLEAVGDQDYFEKALEQATLSGTIRAYATPIESEFCREVDFPEDLEAVRAHVSGTTRS